MEKNIEYYKKKIEEVKGLILDFDIAINWAKKEYSDSGYRIRHLYPYLHLKESKIILEMYLMFLEDKLEELKSRGEIKT
jgi:hypothetical protein